MAILAITSIIYELLTAGKAPVAGLTWIFQVTAYLRVSGFLMVAMFMALYEGYHAMCVKMRKDEMMAAGLHTQISERGWRSNWIDYFLIPLVAPMFGSIPASVAQFSHFWTLDLVYTVSSKPLRAMDKEKGLKVEIEV